MVKKIGLIIKKDSITSFQDLRGGISAYKTMADFVLSGDKFYNLTVPDVKGDWQIEQVTIEAVARAFAGA